MARRKDHDANARTTKDRTHPTAENIRHGRLLDRIDLRTVPRHVLHIRTALSKSHDPKDPTKGS